MLLPLSFGLLAALGFATMFALAKGLGSSFSGQQLVFFRSLIALLIFIPFFINNKYLLRTNRLRIHMLRAILGLGSMVCLFAAASNIPFTILTLVIFTMPLFVAILSFPILSFLFLDFCTFFVLEKFQIFLIFVIFDENLKFF